MDGWTRTAQSSGFGGVRKTNMVVVVVVIGIVVVDVVVVVVAMVFAMVFHHEGHTSAYMLARQDGKMRIAQC